MQFLLRLKLVFESSEDIAPLLEKLQTCAIPHNVFESIEDAMESQEYDPAEVFILSANLSSQGAFSSLQKMENAPQVVVYAKDRLPNIVKVLAPFVLLGTFTAEETSYVLHAALGSLRKNKRLAALENHQKRGGGLDQNPALNLITSLVKKCTSAEDYPDLLNAILTLRGAIDFQDSSLILLDSKGKVLQALHSPKEKKEQIVSIPFDKSVDLSEFTVDEPKAVSITSSIHHSHSMGSFTNHPWSSTLFIGFEAKQAPRKKGTVQSAFLVLYRRELLPFSERDQWLLDMTYGPLSLALEKVVMLKTISAASKEWRSTFDGISEPLTVVDQNFQIVKANKAFAKLVEQDIKKLKGKRCYALLANRRTPCVGCPAMAEAQQRSGVRLQLQGKYKKDLLAWSYGIKTGLETYHFQFYRNVSKETALSSTLIQSEKMAALGRLVGAIAHEINNPLTGILATSQILLNEINPADESQLELRDDIQEIKNAAWRSKKIIDDLLGFTGNNEKKWEEADLHEIIRASLAFSKSALKDIRVDLDFLNDHCVVRTSTSSLQQVFFNLITNAAHAMNGKGTLKIHSGRVNDELVVTIEDNGPGIPQERLDHIFDPFYTSKQEGRGTGLGLSIVKNLVTKLGAKISVSSNVGSGTKFSIAIPETREPALPL